MPRALAGKMILRLHKIGFSTFVIASPVRYRSCPTIGGIPFRLSLDAMPRTSAGQMIPFSIKLMV